MFGGPVEVTLGLVRTRRKTDFLCTLSVSSVDQSHFPNYLSFTFCACYIVTSRVTCGHGEKQRLYAVVLTVFSLSLSCNQK